MCEGRYRVDLTPYLVEVLQPIDPRETLLGQLTKPVTYEEAIALYPPAPPAQPNRHQRRCAAARRR